jgi:hypothetical protein
VSGAIEGGSAASPRKSAILLGALAFVAFGPFVARYTAQPASRYTLTAAIADHGTIDVGGYRSSLGVDRALYQGRLRSDKAPGQPLLGVPVYFAGRALGISALSRIRLRDDLGLWWQTLWGCVAPFAVLLALMFLAARRFASDLHAAATACALGFGTMMLPHATNLYGHLLAALCGFAAWRLVEARTDPSRLLLGGLLAGSAVLVEYHAMIVALVVLGAVVLRVGARAAWFLVGAVPPAGVLAFYQWRAFGAPWHTPFTYYNGTLNGTTRGGYAFPSASGFNDVLIGNRGLLIVSPIVLVAICAAYWYARYASADLGRNSIVACGIVAGYIVLSAGWSGTHLLEEPGPRYAIPALPFLAVPLAAAWRRIARLAYAVSAWGALLMIGAATTFILVPVGGSPIGDYVSRLVHHQFAPTIWSIALGPVGVMLHAASVVAVAWLVVANVRPRGGAPTAATVAVTS